MRWAGQGDQGRRDEGQNSSRGESSSAIISRGLPNSGEPRCSRGCGKPVPPAFLTCKINYEPAILLLLLLDKGFGLLQAFWHVAVAEEEAGETLKHDGEQSLGIDSELELLLSTSFQAQRWERWARKGKSSTQGLGGGGDALLLTKL